MNPHPPGDALLLPAEVAEWLDVDLDWVQRTAASEGLPILGYTSAGEPVVAAAEVRAWLRRPGPHLDET